MAEATSSSADASPLKDDLEHMRRSDLRHRGELRPRMRGAMTRRTVAGLRWSYLSAGLNAVTQVAYVAIMTRLLSPADFGIVAMSQVVINFGQFFTRMGLAQTIVQKDDLSEEDVRISVTTGVLLGALCTSVVFVLAPQVATVYGEPRVVPVLRAMAPTFLLLGFGITSAGLLRRQMRFRELATIEIASTVVSALAGVGSALAGAGVWSLVVATVASSVLVPLLQFFRARHSLRPLLVWEHAKTIYGSGTKFSMLRLLEFLGRNLDTLAVGRYLSSAVTGIYSRAYVLVNMPLTRYLSMALVRVLFPGFATIQKDRVRLRRAFQSLLLLIGILLFPVGAGMAVAAPEIVLVVLGPEFAAASILVPPFVAAAVLFTLSHVAQLICEAIGELNRTLVVQVSSIVVLAMLLISVAGAPVWAFAVVLAIAEGVRQLAFMMLLRRVLEIPGRAILGAYLPGLATGAVVAAGTAVTRQFLLPLDVPTVAVLLAEVGAAAGLLVAALRWSPFKSLRVQVWRRLRALHLGPGDTRLTVRVLRAVIGAPPQGV